MTNGADFSSPDNLALKVTQAIQNEIAATKKERISVPQQRPPRPKLFVCRDEELEALIPNQIPRPPADFKGREEEIKEILSNFDKGATITGLRGMAGVGKTALALVLAERLKDRFLEGHLFLNLKGTTRKPLSTAEAMAQVIHSYYPTDRLPENENELRGLYLSVLAGKCALLLLDNAFDKEQVEPLMPPSNCAVLITSRNKFTLPGLKERDLDVLPPGEARELLLEIAPRIGDRGDSLAKLCGYLPLALRNAASALAERRDISVADYERRLSDKKVRLELVNASFSLSYDLLRPLRRKHWCRLSVFPEDFNLSGGTAVLKMARDASADALSDLVKWSLVDFIRPVDSGEGRYRLHDLARLYAESRLESRESDDAKQRLTKHYLKVLSDADKHYDKGGENILEGLRLFDREWANIKEGQAWAEVVMRNATNIKTKSDLKFALRIVNSYSNDGVNVLALRQHPHEIIQRLELALIAARQMKARGSEGAHLGGLGNAYFDLGEVSKAIEYYEQALAIDREIGYKLGEETQLGNIGNAYSDLGEVCKAVEYLDQALAFSREIHDKRGEGRHLGNIGNAYSDSGEVRKAIEYYEQALYIDRDIGDIRGEGIQLCNLGSAYYHLSEFRKAIEYYEQALAIDQEIGDKQGEGTELSNLGCTYSQLGGARKAVEYYKQALDISREIGDRRGEGNRLGNLGSAYAVLGEPRKAIEFYNQALKISREIGDRRGEGARSGRPWPGLAPSGRDSKGNRSLRSGAQNISREIGDLSIEGEDLINFGKAYVALGRDRQGNWIL